jgi:pimeloyl-ACP methyl ester carboxylesterase
MKLSRRHAFVLGAAAVTAPNAFAQTPLESARPAERGYVRCRYGLMHFHASGSGDPTLVMLHTPPGSGLSVPELSIGRRVLRPDWPGFGASDAPTLRPSAQDYAGALIEALDGSSFGTVDLFAADVACVPAIEAALLRPDRVRRLVLARVPYFKARDLPGVRAAAQQPRPFFSDPEFVGNAWRRAMAENASQAQALTRFVDDMRSGPQASWFAQAAFADPLEKRLKALKLPVLVLVMPGLLVNQTRAAAKIIKHAVVREVADVDKAVAISAFLSLPNEAYPNVK